MTRLPLRRALLMVLAVLAAADTTGCKESSSGQLDAGANDGASSSDASPSDLVRASDGAVVETDLASDDLATDPLAHDLAEADLAVSLDLASPVEADLTGPVQTDLANPVGADLANPVGADLANPDLVSVAPADLLVDDCPADPLKTTPGICGCGVVDDATDVDLDDVADCVDPCIDSDGDGYGDTAVGSCAGAVVDCAPANPLLFQNVVLYDDEDEDGFRALGGGGPSACIGAVPFQKTTNPIVDCNDRAPLVGGDEYTGGDTCATCIDLDLDGRGPGCLAGPDCAPRDPWHWADCATCIDGDSDQHGVGCDAGPDCADNSALQNASLPEIPDDGLDNDCAGDGDLTHSQLPGIYVSCGGDDTTGDGTAVKPFATLTKGELASDRKNGGPGRIYLATAHDAVDCVYGTRYSYVFLTSSVFGGYRVNSGVWTLGAYSGSIGSSDGADIAGNFELSSSLVGQYRVGLVLHRVRFALNFPDGTFVSQVLITSGSDHQVLRSRLAPQISPLFEPPTVLPTKVYASSGVEIRAQRVQLHDLSILTFNLGFRDRSAIEVIDNGQAHVSLMDASQCFTQDDLYTAFDLLLSEYQAWEAVDARVDSGGTRYPFVSVARSGLGCAAAVISLPATAALKLYRTTGGAIYTVGGSNSVVQIDRSSVSGEVEIGAGGTLEATNTLFDRSVRLGGPSKLIGNTLYGRGGGYGIRTHGSAAAVLVNNLIGVGIADDARGVDFVAGTADLVNNFFFRPTGGSTAQPCWVRQSATCLTTEAEINTTCTASCGRHTGNRAGDPGVDASGNLTTASAAVDIGANPLSELPADHPLIRALSIDRGGTPRPSRSGYDIGADEVP